MTILFPVIVDDPDVAGRSPTLAGEAISNLDTNSAGKHCLRREKTTVLKEFLVRVFTGVRILQ
jgi:hypothetical protein